MNRVSPTFDPYGYFVELPLETIKGKCLQLANKVHELAMKVYEAVLSHPHTTTILSRAVSIFVYDKGSQEMLDAARAKLVNDVNRDYYCESARFLSTYITEYLKSAFKHGLGELRPSWMDELIHENRYTFKGMALKAFVESNEGLISRYIELNLLNGFGRLAQHVARMQSHNRFAFLDLMKDLLNAAKGHLYKCEQHRRQPELAQSPLVGLAAKESEVKEQVIDTTFSLFLPNGIDDLELPLRDSLMPHLGPKMMAIFKEELLPDLLTKGLALAKTPFAKTMLLNEGLLLEKENIENEYHPDVPALQNGYPLDKYRDLEQILHDVIYSGLSYAIPDSMSRFFAALAPRRLAQAGAEKMTEELSVISLQEVVRIVFQKALEALNEGGEWKEKERRMCFESKSIVFEHTLEVKNQNALRLEEKLREETMRMQELAQTTGANPLRLFQLAQSTVFRINHAVYQPQEEPGIASFFSSIYANVTKSVTSMSMSRTGIVELIQKINRNAAEKLMLPEHDPLFAFSAEVVLQTLSGNRQ